MPRVRSRSFFCDQCEKSYPDVSGLNRHKMTHIPELYSHCQYCDKTFSQKTARNIHENTHTRNKPQECRLCHRRFGDPSSLSRHLKEVEHLGDPFECTVEACAYECWRPAALKKHQREVHGIRDSVLVPRARCPVKKKAEAIAKEREGRSGPSRTGHGRATRKRETATPEAPFAFEELPLTYQSMVKPEAHDNVARYLGVDFGTVTPYQPHHYAQDLPPLPPPTESRYATFEGNGTETPWMGARGLSVIPPSPPQYTAVEAKPRDTPWNGARRYLPSPDNSSARQSPLMSPNVGGVHSLAPSPVNVPVQLQTFEPPAFQKAYGYQAQQTMPFGGQPYPRIPSGYLPDLGHLHVPGEVHDAYGMGAYINYSYGA